MHDINSPLLLVSLRIPTFGIKVGFFRNNLIIGRHNITHTWINRKGPLQIEHQGLMDQIIHSGV